MFTGGVGERAPAVRAAAAKQLAVLGVRVDEAANLRADGDMDIGAPSAAAATLVVVARDDLEISRQVRNLLAAD